MNSKYIAKDKLLIFEIDEEIDHHMAEILKRKADYEIEKYMPAKTIFDFNGVSFMDSAGIGMVLGRYKFAKMLGGTIEMTNVNPGIKKVFETCGIPKIIKIS